eukprot:433403-Alexandrium_andersonii.AAC.1
MTSLRAAPMLILDEKMNFKRQKIEPQLFCHPGGPRMAVHVDDPILAAKVEEMKPIMKELAGWVL